MIRDRLASRALVSLFALGAGATVVLAPGAGASLGTGTGVARVIAGDVLYRPGSLKASSYVVYCADANGSLTNMRRTTWSGKNAFGRGDWRVNSCTPTCVTGSFQSYPATARLSQPKPTKYGRLFSDLSVVYTVNAVCHTVNQSLPLKPL